MYSLFGEINKYPFPIMILDLNHRIKSLNPCFEKIFEVKKTHLIHKTASEFFGEDSYKRSIQPHINTVGEGGLVSNIEILTDRRGKPNSMLLEYFPLYTEKGKIHAVLILFRQHQKKKQGQCEAFSDINESLEVLNICEDAICIINNNFEVKFLNQKGHQLFNKNNTDILGKKCYDIICHGKIPSEICPWTKNDDGQHAKIEPAKFYGKDHYVSIAPIANAYGHIYSALCKIQPYSDLGKDHVPSEKPSQGDTLTKQLLEHQEFRKRLQQQFSRLTAHNLIHCTLIRMNYTTKEIAIYFNINPSSVQRSRVRLKKKLGLSREDNLFEYLMHF